MRKSEVEDNVHLKGLIMSIFGYEGGVSREEFVENLTGNESKWALNGDTIRQKIKYFLNDDVLDAAGF